MNILLIGSGGREHALAWAICASPLLDKLYCAPGNAGIAALAECIALDVADHTAVVEFCQSHRIGLVVIGPEAPLVAGLSDDLTAAGVKAFGPSKTAAQLEGSKGFTKDICAKYTIPTAAYGRFREKSAALGYLSQHPAPIVIKADGLAAGKGVTVAMNDAEAQDAIDDIFAGKFGEAGLEVVIEEFLEGEEVSFFALCDGETALALATAQDHKRVGDGDTGPNTGGMGAYSPAPVMTDTVCNQVMTQIIMPTLTAMRELGSPYKGVLYAGLMITETGPKLIEYNVRFGDPECQTLMMRLKDDIVTLMLAAIDATLDKVSVRWHDRVALTVVMAANGYPASVEKGSRIIGLDEAGTGPDVEIFHAGTVIKNGQICADGGRVLNITGLGNTISEAQQCAYKAVDKINWPQGFCRRDIGWRAVAHENMEK